MVSLRGWAAVRCRANGMMGRTGMAVPARRFGRSKASLRELSSIELRVDDPQALLNAIASSYKSTPRILMEYVDNAVDSAEAVRQGSSKPFLATVTVDIDEGAKTIWIRDNCAGMDPAKLERLVAGVGRSVKRGVSWQNGQFGFGVHAFRAAAERISVFSAHTKGTLGVLKVDRSSSTIGAVYTGNLEKVLKDDPVIAKANERGIFASTGGNIFPENSETGTAVAISDFDPVWFDTVPGRVLAKEIENHFESLLLDEKLNVTVRQIPPQSADRRRTRSYRCRALDYSALEGTRFERSIPVTMEDGSVQDLICNIILSSTVAHYNKPVRFFRRGRCIAKVSDTHSFLESSEYKGEIWENPSVSGYVLMPDAIEPVLTRDEFLRSENRRRVYDALHELEAELYEPLQGLMNSIRDDSLHNLEDVLSGSIADLFSTDEEATTSDESQGEDEEYEDEEEEEDDEDQLASDAEKVDPPPRKLTVEKVEYETLTTPRAPKRKPKDVKQDNRPYEIRFVKSEEEGSAAKRSFCVENVIYINVNHEEFKARLSKKQKSGTFEMGPRMAAYLANEMAQYYRSGFYDRFDVATPTDRTQLYQELIDSAVSLESRLSSSLSKRSNKAEIPVDV